MNAQALANHVRGITHFLDMVVDYKHGPGRIRVAFAYYFRFFISASISARLFVFKVLLGSLLRDDVFIADF